MCDTDDAAYGNEGKRRGQARELGNDIYYYDANFDKMDLSCVLYRRSPNWRRPLLDVP